MLCPSNWEILTACLLDWSALDCFLFCFSTHSVSEYLMGDIVTQQQLNSDSKVKSCDNIAKAAHEEEQAPEKPEPKKS